MNDAEKTGLHGLKYNLIGRLHFLQPAYFSWSE